MRRLKESNIQRKKIAASVRRITLITLLKARVTKKNALDGPSRQFILIGRQVMDKAGATRDTRRKNI